MKVNLFSNTTFKRCLNPEEKSDYTETLKLGKQKAGNTGHSVLIVPSSSLPHNPNNNTGCGNMLNKESMEFFDFAKQYWGINYVQLLPEGEFAKRGCGYKPYSGTSLDLGVQLINLNLLATDKYGKLLDENDIKKVINSNINNDKDIHINIENTLEKDSATDRALRKAFDKLTEANTVQKKELLNEIEKYKKENGEWLERKSLFHSLVLKNRTHDHRFWNDTEKNLFDIKKVSELEREKVIDGIKSNSELNKEIEFYVFKQFLAEKHLKEAKKELNQRGIKLSGDMIIGCSYDEVWMYPKAFYKNYSTLWGLNAINYDTPEGKEFLRLKTRNFAKRYDGIRVDAGWLYAKQYLLNNTIPKESFAKEYNSKILDIIENEVKKVKGADFDLQNLMYEFETDVNKYSIFFGNQLKPEVCDRVKIYKTDNLNSGWGTVQAYKERGWKDGTYMLGATNHDSVSIKELYKNKSVREQQTDILSKILKIPSEKLQTVSEFVQAKFAEPIRSTHNMFFFADALNLDECYNQGNKEFESYRLKIPSNYQEKYFKSLENGEGFNIMDSLQKAFIADGLDKSEPELYKKIVKYRNILEGGDDYQVPVKKGNVGKITLIAAGIIFTFTTAWFFLKKYNRIATNNQNT